MNLGEVWEKKPGKANQFYWHPIRALFLILPDTDRFLISVHWIACIDVYVKILSVIH
jgi:hypothetical protein